MKEPKILFPLNNKEKKALHKRLDEVLNQKIGRQVIILIDKDKHSDYFQNECLSSMLKRIEVMAREYAELTSNILLNAHE